MRRSRRHLVTILALAAAWSAAPAWGTASLDDVLGGFAACPQEGAAVSFANYDLGATFEGLVRIDTVRSCTPPPPVDDLLHYGRGNDVRVIYGQCSADGIGPCTPLVEVQTAPGCERNAAVLDDALAAEPITVRGVPGSALDDGRQLQLYTAQITVDVYGDSPERALRAAQAIRAAEGSAGVGPGVDLPPPAPGHLDGRLLCGPRISGLTAAGGVFCTGRTRGCRRRAVTIRLRLSEAAKIEGFVRKRRPGHPQGVAVGFVRLKGARGANTLRFTHIGGRIVRRGSYTLRLAATNAKRESSARRSVSFRVR